MSELYVASRRFMRYTSVSRRRANVLCPVRSAQTDASIRDAPAAAGTGHKQMPGTNIYIRDAAAATADRQAAVIYRSRDIEEQPRSICEERVRGCISLYETRGQRRQKRRRASGDSPTERREEPIKSIYEDATQPPNARL